MYDRLFEPVFIGALKLQNRFVMPAMGTNYGDSSGFVIIIGSVRKTALD
jgi:2,4-dienoyl-CoA reductase-like NADH-dependent reductase (Old Yellow Enzyme family)